MSTLKTDKAQALSRVLTQEERLMYTYPLTLNSNLRLVEMMKEYIMRMAENNSCINDQIVLVNVGCGVNELSWLASLSLDNLTSIGLEACIRQSMLASQAALKIIKELKIDCNTFVLNRDAGAAANWKGVNIVIVSSPALTPSTFRGVLENIARSIDQQVLLIVSKEYFDRGSRSALDVLGKYFTVEEGYHLKVHRKKSGGKVDHMVPLLLSRKEYTKIPLPRGAENLLSIVNPVCRKKSGSNPKIRYYECLKAQMLEKMPRSRERVHRSGLRAVPHDNGLKPIVTPPPVRKVNLRKYGL